jgi:hypothetical protein
LRSGKLDDGFSLVHPDGLRALEMYDEGYRRIETYGVLKEFSWLHHGPDYATSGVQKT